MSYNVGQYYEFTREQDGSVRMDCKWKDADGNTQSVREVVLADVWVTIVADVSMRGSTPQAIADVTELHQLDGKDDATERAVKQKAMDNFILQRSLSEVDGIDPKWVDGFKQGFAAAREAA